MPREDGGPLVIPTRRRRGRRSYQKQLTQTHPIRSPGPIERAPLNDNGRDLGRQSEVNLRPPYTHVNTRVGSP